MVPIATRLLAIPFVLFRPERFLGRAFGPAKYFPFGGPGSPVEVEVTARA